VALASDESLQQASALLATLRQTTEALHNNCQTIEVMVLESLTLHRQGCDDAAIDALRRTLDMANAGGFISPFVESGPLMANLLRQVPEQDNAFIRHILSALNEADGEAQTALESGRSFQSQTDPLTNREFEILELLAKRLQNKEIAARLFVSPETVKSHLKHLFQKLGVSNRRDAATMADQITTARSAATGRSKRIEP